MLSKKEIRDLQINDQVILHYRFNNPNHRVPQNGLNGLNMQEVDYPGMVVNATPQSITLLVNGRERKYNKKDFSQSGHHGIDSTYHFFLSSPAEAHETVNYPVTKEEAVTQDITITVNAGQLRQMMEAWFNAHPAANAARSNPERRELTREYNRVVREIKEQSRCATLMKEVD